MQVNDYTTTNIEITSLYFRHKANSNEFEGYPKTMIMDGKEYTFLNDSLRFLIKRGQNLVKLFDVSDGSHRYRIKLDETNTWSLVSSH